MGVLSEFGVDEERLTEIVKSHDISFKWMHDNLPEIQESHAGKFIAIYKKEIVDFDEDQGKLLKRLKDKCSIKEVEEIFINYINPKGYILILFVNLD